MDWVLVLEYLKVVIWPAFILTIAVMFRKAIRTGLSRLKEINVLGSSAILEGQVAQEALERTNPEPKAIESSTALPEEVVVARIELILKTMAVVPPTREKPTSHEMRQVRNALQRAVILTLETFDYPFRVTGFSSEAAQWMEQQTGVTGWDELSIGWIAVDRAWMAAALPYAGLADSYEIFAKQWIEAAQLFQKKFREQLRATKQTYAEESNAIEDQAQ